MLRLLGLGLVFSTTGAFGTTLFYSGDFDETSFAVPNFIWPPFPEASRYNLEEFRVDSPFVVTGIFSDQIDQFGTPTVPVDFEFRAGMGPGNGGTIVSSSSLEIATLTPTSQSSVKRFTISGLNVFLPAGTYWVTMRALDGGIMTTTGTNGVGPTAGDNRSINYDPIGNYTLQNRDVSYGVVGYAVPEPATFGAIAFGLAALAHRPRR